MAIPKYLRDPDYLKQGFFTKALEVFIFIAQIERYPSSSFRKSESYMARKVNLTYTHASKLIQDLVDAGLIEKNKEGRRLRLTLTDKGRKVYPFALKLKQDWRRL
jgi:predicted transcriptional regulator